MLDNTRIRLRALDQTLGLAQTPKCVEKSKASIRGKEKALPAVAEPDTDMIGSVEFVEELPQPASIPHRIGGPSISPPTASKPLEKAAPKAASTKAECPPELRPIVEAEERRAAQAAANLALCSATINSVEATLLPLTNGSNRQFVDSMRVYLRAAIAQYMATGPATMPPVLPPRPADPPLRAPNARSTITPAVPVQQSKGTWAAMARNGLRQKAVPTVKAVPQPSATAPKKDAPKAKVDKRLFIRLGNDHPWRKLSPMGLRSAMDQQANIDILLDTSVHRTRTGFAILALTDNIRQRILNSSSNLAAVNAKLEEASDLVVLRIPNVPVKLNTVDGHLSVDAERVSDEIYFKTSKAPSQVRPLGQCRPGALHSNWKATFPRESAPRAGFRSFDESGMATKLQLRRQIQQCCRCHGYYATRGCSRALACWNCGLTTHSIAECKAITKCSNCGNPHRSDSRDCLARPT